MYSRVWLHERYRRRFERGGGPPGNILADWEAKGYSVEARQKRPITGAGSSHKARRARAEQRAQADWSEV